MPSLPLLKMSLRLLCKLHLGPLSYYGTTDNSTSPSSSTTIVSKKHYDVKGKNSENHKKKQNGHSHPCKRELHSFLAYPCPQEFHQPLTAVFAVLGIETIFKCPICTLCIHIYRTFQAVSQAKITCFYRQIQAAHHLKVVVSAP
jgi:hypothetical protein